MISAIIPTRNRSDLLQLALKSLVNQYLPTCNFEVIVVDNGSNDNTEQVVRNFQSSLCNLSYIYAEEPGLHVGRHAGMNASKGDVLVFADDDIEAIPTWLSSINEAFKAPSVVMVGGNNYPLFINTPPSWLLKMWNRPTFRGHKAIPSLSVIEAKGAPRVFSPYYVWGCNFAIRKDVLIDAGGFHPDGMPKEQIRFRGDGETHVSRYVAKSGLKCIFHPGASVYHKVTPERMTFEYFYQRGFNQGVSDSYTQLRDSFDTDVKSKSNLLKKILISTLKNILNSLDNREVRYAYNQLKLGHAEGYAYHQAAYIDDPEVRKWVHRPIYY